MHAENAAVLAHGAETGPPPLGRETPAEKLRNARQILRGLTEETHGLAMLAGLDRVDTLIADAQRELELHDYRQLCDPAPRPSAHDPAVVGSTCPDCGETWVTHGDVCVRPAVRLPRYAVVRYGRVGEQLAILERAAATAGEYFGRKHLRGEVRWTKQRLFMAHEILRDATADDRARFGASEPPAL